MEKVVIYTYLTCGFCIMAKDLLEKNKIKYIEKVITRKEVQELSKKTKSLTVPQIFIDGKFIGGYTELSKLL